MISKTTWCFDCKDGKMKRKEMYCEHWRKEKAVYYCTAKNCEARHEIILRPHVYSRYYHSYHWTDGRRIFY